MHIVKNLTNSPHDLSIRLPAMGSVTATFAPEYLEAMRGMGYFEITEASDPLDHDENGKKGGAKAPIGDPATVDEIKAAIDLLDAGDDTHWTAAGLPAVEAVAQITGKAVTRKAIAEAAPNTQRPG